MKTNKLKIIFLLPIIFALSCEQDLTVLQDPCDVDPESCESIPDCPTDATDGTLDLTKFVTIGNSFVAGVQAGALYNNSQSNSLAKIMFQQFGCVSDQAAFNQPDIGSVNGYNVQFSVPGVINLGRMVLFDPDGPTGARTAAPYPSGYPGAAAVTCPSAIPATPALPAPYNTADVPSAFGGDKAALHNFGVPFIFLGQALTPDTGNPASPYYNPFWARFASAPGVKPILTDAITAQGSFYLVWLGVDDVLLWAAGGADEAGTVPLTSQPTFAYQYDLMIDTLMTYTGTAKGVLGNVPNITSIPYFYTVPWNTITLNAATATSLTTNLANNYNAFLEAMDVNNIITPEEKAKRLLTYATGKNGVLLIDEDLTDLSAYMAGPYAGLLPYAKARQATATDLVPLSAGSILGTCYSNNPNAVWGVSYPVTDKHMLTTAEITVILTRTAEFNAAISAAVTANDTRLVLANVNSAYAAFVTAKAAVANGVTITPSFAPPAGAFSEDGIHPNSRGYAFTANIFIDAINAKFGSSIPKAKYTSYSGTGLPVNP